MLVFAHSDAKVLMFWLDADDVIDIEKMKEWVPNKYQLMTLTKKQLMDITKTHYLSVGASSNKEKLAEFIISHLGLSNRAGVMLNEDQKIADILREERSRCFFLKAVGLRGGAGGANKAINKKNSEKVNKDASLALKKKDFYELPLTKT